MWYLGSAMKNLSGAKVYTGAPLIFFNELIRKLSRISTGVSSGEISFFSEVTIPTRRKESEFCKGDMSKWYVRSHGDITGDILYGVIQGVIMYGVIQGDMDS